MLHILNGDAAAAVFVEAGVAGERLVWGDILVEGPAVPVDATGAPMSERAAYLAGRLGIDREQYLRGAQERARGLEAAPAHDEVVLWFEQDLFCAVHVWALLDWFARRAPASRLSLVYPDLDDVKGLGSASPERLAELFATRRPLTAAARTVGQQAWRAYAAADPLASAPLVDRESEALPFVREAFRCHLGRFPALGTGLSEGESTVLATLRHGPRRFGELFREVPAHARVRRHGMGDVQLAACVRGLVPLVDIAGSEVMGSEISITQAGRDVVDGERDWVDVRPLDAWLGGVRLTSRPRWRWDGARGRLVEDHIAR